MTVKFDTLLDIKSRVERLKETMPMSKIVIKLSKDMNRSIRCIKSRIELIEAMEDHYASIIEKEASESSEKKVLIDKELTLEKVYEISKEVRSLHVKEISDGTLKIVADRFNCTVPEVKTIINLRQAIGDMQRKIASQAKAVSDQEIADLKRECLRLSTELSTVSNRDNTLLAAYTKGIASVKDSMSIHEPHLEALAAFMTGVKLGGGTKVTPYYEALVRIVRSYNALSDMLFEGDDKPHVTTPWLTE